MRGLVCTTPEEFENAVILLQLGLPSTLIRHETELFENALQTPALRFSGEGKNLKNELFENHDITIIM